MILPSIFLSVLCFLVLKDHLGLPLSAMISAVLTLVLFCLSSFAKNRSYAGSLLRIGSSVPVFYFGGKSYTLVGLSVSLSQSEASGRYDKEMAYERLCRFADAISSFGTPSAYILYSVPESSSPSSQTERKALLLSWSSGRESDPPKERAEQMARQMEGIVGLVFPGAHTQRLDREDLELLVSSPIPHSLSNVRRKIHWTREQPPSAAPPPPNRPDPSSLITSEPPPVPDRGLLVGTVYSRGQKVAPLCIPLQDLRRHVSIFGATGSGKSTTAISLALRLYSMGTSVLILDWHGEHSSVVEDAGGRVLTPGSEGGLTINPLAGFSSSDLGFQVEFITDVFAQVFRFTPPQSYMFREALKAAYRSKMTPTLSDLIAELSLLPMRSSWDHETRMALMRRLKSFTEGACGFALAGLDSLPREEIFQGLVSIDLTRLKDVNNRMVYANILMKMVYDHCVQRGEQPCLSHVLFIEEAQNVFPPRRPEDPMTIGERILAELRKFGEGVVVVSQFPSSVSQDVVKNTAVRIIHAIRSGEDLKLLSGATSLSEAQIGAMPLLSVGEAIVCLPNRSGNFFVRVYPDPLISSARTLTRDTLGVIPPSGAAQPS
ncbi:MAG: ATP-binding protein [Candidatus Verstraetearchaeota archaeon]|nr:ATP-binding protein [Candidatus Verstraetearchaeota archaeon]